jgi:predicted DNA binding protein
MNLDNASRTTKKDRARNYWNKKKLNQQIERFKTISKEKFNVTDPTQLTEKQLKQVIKLATKPFTK